MIFREEINLEEVEAKARILVDALPYIRDFNNKIIVICFEASDLLGDDEEKELMRDIVLLKLVGMRPVIVHDSKMGHDKFRENKMLAKMVEQNGVKSVGLSGIDRQTIVMTLDGGYIPVITPNDIDNEDNPISAAAAAAQIAVSLDAEKLVFMSEIKGVPTSDGKGIIAQIKYSDFKLIKFDDARIRERAKLCAEMIEKGIPRVHFIDAKVKHSILLELFSIRGIGTAVMSNSVRYYPHEKKKNY